LKKTVTDSIGGILPAVSNDVQSLRTTQDKLQKSVQDIAGGMPAVSKDIQSVKTAQEDLKKTVTDSIGGINKNIDAVGNGISMAVAAVKKEVSGYSDSLKSTSETISRNSDQTAEKLLKELAALKDNSEVLRRMCTTDEEKFLGGMTTVIFNRTSEMEEEISKILTNVRNWFNKLDNKQKETTTEFLEKLEEQKKLLLFDISKIAETVRNMDGAIATAEERPIGAEVIATSDRVETIADIVPRMQETISSINEQMENVTAEVKRMRWFVVAAVGISIVVLVTSFIM